VQGFAPSALAMTAQTHRKGTKPFVGEIVHEILIPTPRSVVGTMNEEQRDWMRCGGTPLVDDFKHRRAPKPAARSRS